jgi:hypothetical protein
MEIISQALTVTKRRLPASTPPPFPILDTGLSNLCYRGIVIRKEPIWKTPPASMTLSRVCVTIDGIWIGEWIY